MSYQKVVIIGAPRSGTNMLRDVLTSIPAVETWPCDEINYIWRHGNVRQETDSFTAAQATPGVRKFIRRKFDLMARMSKASVLIEKTCANSLRVPFVDAVLPDARYIFIVRDGLDVVGSAKERWEAALDLPYLLKKARFVPASDFPYYASRYFVNRLYRLFSTEKRLAFWGPQFEGLQEALRTLTLEEVCGLQWRACVESSARAFSAMDENRMHFVKYEDFVQQPAEGLQSLLDFIGGVDATAAQIESAVHRVSARSIGKGRISLDAATHERVASHIRDVLEQYGYER